MVIRFKDERLLRDCNERRRAVKRWGPECADLVFLRLQQFRAAANLEQLALLPQLRLHMLDGGRTLRFSVWLKRGSGLRIVFVPGQNPVRLRPDGGVDLPKVDQVIVLAIEDYHD